MSAKPINFIVLCIDRLGSSYLGPYGGTLVDTPAFNRLAADGTLAEFCLSDTSELNSVYESYWGATHAASRLQVAAPEDTSWIGQLTADGYATWLFTDDESLAHHRWAQHFAHRECFPQSHECAPAESLDSTQNMASLTRWMSVLQQQESPFCAWIHTRGLSGSWDAPSAWRLALADPEDPQPPLSTEPPESDLRGTDVDPDWLWGWTCAYAAQVRVIDECLDWFLRFLDVQRWSENTSLLVTSPRGYPMGEHGIVGAGNLEPLAHAEWLHVPLFLRGPGNGHSTTAGPRSGAAARITALTQPHDLRRWLQSTQRSEDDWSLDLAADRAADPTVLGTDIAISLAPSEIALRSHKWHFVTGTQPEDLRPPRLYMKPDDRWEQHNVALRLPEEVTHWQEQRRLLFSSKKLH